MDETAWAARVRANREQVDRVREVPDGTDFYAPVSGIFVDDPRRIGDELLEALLALSRPGDTWIDIGAGAGRYALPLALAVRRVIAVEPSAGMAGRLEALAAEHGIDNVEVIRATWPLPATSTPAADVALIAHVGYDIEQIGPFLDAMEAAARRRCVALMMDRTPASMADPFWLAVHGVERVTLPALPELLAILDGRGRRPRVRRMPRPARRWGSEEELLRGLRRQLWITEGGHRDLVLREELARRIRRGAGGVFVDGGPREIGIVDWSPRAEAHLGEEG